MLEISTSVLNVEDEQKSMQTFYNLEVAGTDYYHIDVMDGKFVEKNTSKRMYSYSNSIKQMSNLPLDVHLMVSDVKEYIEQYIPLEPHFITIHYEACKNKEEIIQLLSCIKENNIKCGLSIKPETTVEDIYEYLPLINLCLIMSVEPGKGGQKFIPDTIKKVEILKEYINKNRLETYIEVDGGINKLNARELEKAGADIVVVGTAIINAKDYKKEIKLIKNQ